MKTILLSTTMLVTLGSVAMAADPFVIKSIAPLPAADVLADGLVQVPVAEGKFKLENPGKYHAYYGYGTDGPLVPVKGAMPTKDKLVEATKTEPDKNTYLVLTGQKGPAKGYNYGTHFIFQGHENAPKDADGVAHGALTRINLDANQKHRVTLMAEETVDGKPLPVIDGSSWNPFANVLLLTSEEGPEGGVWQATTDFPSQVTDISGATGRASYEGVQVDSDGTIWLVEDAGGKGGSSTKNAKQPNSFLYRFIPTDKTDLTKGGKLQVLQLLDQFSKPIVFNDGKLNEDILNPLQKVIYGYNYELSTRWVTIHDTATDGSEPFDANKLAKAASGTPFKRPENGVFRPGSSFKEFYFTATGDTNIKTEAGQEYGGFGAVLRLTQKKPSADTGRISTILRGDAAHTGFDNLSFLDGNQLLVGEDAGDKMHAQRGAFDSLWLIDVTADYSAKDPVRVLAQARDEMAKIDVGFAGMEGYQNDGDNEITGVHVSDGDPSVEGLLGVAVPTPFENGWRVFYTRQHGTNVTFEIKRK